MIYYIFFLVAFSLSVFFTEFFRWVALRFNIIDNPALEPERRIHQKPIPLLGGLAIYLSFFVTLFVLLFSNRWPSGEIYWKNLIGIFLATTILIIVGFFDDKKNLKPIWQLVFSVVAIIIIIIFGIGIKQINNPFGPGIISFEQNKIEIINLAGVPYYFSWPADLISFIWLFIVIYAIKLLAGLDGLVPGVSVIGCLIIAGFCLFTAFVQPQVALLSLLLGAASLGFLIFNFHPAKIFLGTSGEMFLGLMLGVLAIISGSKIATLLLILGIPILDLAWVILRRVIKEKHSPMKADRKHLHFRLLDFGFSHRGAVIFLWSLSLLFGLVGIAFPATRIKVLALSILIMTMIILALIITRKKKLDLN